MSFDRRDIRPAMDVYTLDNACLGTVLAIYPGAITPAVDPGVVPTKIAGSDLPQTSEIDGERLGPGPTQALGNTGPDRQSARARYATALDGAEPIGRGELVVGRWWGLRGRRTIPMDAVQTVSLERVVLALKRNELQ